MDNAKLWLGLCIVLLATEGIVGYAAWLAYQTMPRHQPTSFTVIVLVIIGIFALLCAWEALEARKNKEEEE